MKTQHEEEFLVVQPQRIGCSPEARHADVPSRLARSEVSSYKTDHENL
jgi:hypothetical protein